MLISIFLLVLLGIDWASGYVIASYCTSHGVTTLGYVFWQTNGSFILMALVQAFRSDLKPVKGSFSYSLLSGIFCVVIPEILIYSCVRHIPSGILTIIGNVAPVFTYSLAIAFKQERYSLGRMLMVLLAVVGILIIVSPQHQISSNFDKLWFAISLLIPLSYAFSVVFIARFRPQSGNILNYTMWMLFAGGIIVTILTLNSNQFYPLHLTELPSKLILLQVLLSSVGYFLLFKIIGKAGPVYFTLVNAITVCTGLVYGKIIFNQQFNHVTYIAVAIILSSILGLSLLQSRFVKSKT